MATSVLVQYIVVRGDLLSVLKWPLGALMAQACHACSAALHQFREDPDTVAYLTDVDNMHKIVLQAPDEESLKRLDETLTSAGLDHKLWREQPENVVTCLATKPLPKEEAKIHFKQFKLFR